MPELQDVLGPTGGSIVRVLQSSPYADAAADPATVDELATFAAYEGIEDHARLVDGAWPVAGATPVDVAISQPAAALLGVATGDVLRFRSRLDTSRLVDVRVSGTWAADPADEWWMADPLALAGAVSSGSFTTRGPLVVAAQDLVTGPLTEPLNAEWRAIPRVDGFTPESIAAVEALATGIDGRINAALPFSNQAQVLTRLPEILATVDRSVLVTQAGILLLLIQFGVLAGYAVILVAALLLERRRTETALLRARGGGFGHLVSMAFGEALLVTVPAVIAAPWAAALLVQAVRLNPALEGVGLETPLPGWSTFAVALVGGALAILALTIPTLLSGAPIAGVRAAVGRQVGRTLPQRLGLDLALVVLAVIALIQLRLYGAPITRTARGALGVDPLLVAAPAIGLLAGAVLAVRFVPRLAELAERLLVRGRRLVPALAGRQVARRPLRYTRAALLLILAAALGTFASAHAATWTRSQGDQASYAAGADVRLTPDCPGHGSALGDRRRAPGGAGGHGGDTGRGRLDPARARRSATGRCWASTVPRWRTSCASGTMPRARRRSTRCARSGPPGARHRGSRSPRARAGSRSSRTRRSSRSRATCRSPTTRRASASRSSSSTPTAGSRGCRAPPGRSTPTACASSPR